jgi:hypothetical protein
MPEGNQRSLIDDEDMEIRNIILKMENESLRLQLEMERLENRLSFMTLSSASFDTSLTTRHNDSLQIRNSNQMNRQEQQRSTPIKKDHVKRDK